MSKASKPAKPISTNPPGGWHLVQWRAAKKTSGELGYINSSGGVRVIATLLNNNARPPGAAHTDKTAPTAGRRFVYHPKAWTVELKLPQSVGKSSIQKFQYAVEARAWVEAQVLAFLHDLHCPKKERHPSWQPRLKNHAPQAPTQQPKLTGLFKPQPSEQQAQ